MRKHWFKVLLLLVGVAITVVLFVEYEVHKIVLAWFWSIEDTLVIVARTFFLRRVSRPLWNLVTRLAVIRFLGFNRWGEFRRRIFAPIKHCRQRAIEQWRTLSLIWRAVETVCVIAICAAIVWVTCVVPLILPISVWIIIKLYYWLGDQIFDQASYYLHPKYWVHRFEHRNKLVWEFLRPWRHGCAIIEVALEKTRAKKRSKENRDKS